MKSRSIFLAFATVLILLITGCTIRLSDTGHEKIIEGGNGKGDGQTEDSSSVEDTTHKNGDLADEEKGGNKEEDENIEEGHTENNPSGQDTAHESNDSADKEKVPENNVEDNLEDDLEDGSEDDLEKRSHEAMGAIRNYDTKTWSEFAHPQKGIRFSPYTFVNGDEDLVFDREKLKNASNDSTIHTWGIYDGIGEPIKLNFSEYYKRFIYDADFAKAEEVSFNKPLGGGNTINNTFEFYKDSVIIEYHFPGTNPEFGGMDWRSLKIAFEKYDGTWYIVGIIHDEWTI